MPKVADEVPKSIEVLVDLRLQRIVPGHAAPLLPKMATTRDVSSLSYPKSEKKDLIIEFSEAIVGANYSIEDILLEALRSLPDLDGSVWKPTVLRVAVFFDVSAVAAPNLTLSPVALSAIEKLGVSLDATFYPSAD